MKTASNTPSAVSNKGWFISLVLLVCQPNPGFVQAAVEIPDPALKAGVRAELNKPSGELKEDDMESLTRLSIPSQGIANLHGLESAINLWQLDLRDNEITNLEPLSALTNLWSLRLADNRIDDLTPLRVITENLGSLDLRNNYITDIEPLSEFVIAPRAGFSLENNFLDLSEGSPDREVVESHFGSYRPAQRPVEEIVIDDPALESLIRLSLDKPEGNLTNYDLAHLITLDLKELGYLRGSGVESLSGLEYAVNLRRLNFFGTYTLVRDLSPLSDLVKLEFVNLNGQWIQDVTPLSGLVHLEELSIAGTPLADIRPLSNLKQLKVLDLWSNEINDLEPLSDLSQLEHVNVGRNPIDFQSGTDNRHVIDSLINRMVSVTLSFGEHGSPFDFPFVERIGVSLHGRTGRLRWRQSAFVVYRVQSSANLQDWTTMESPAPTESGEDMEVAFEVSNSSALFFRVLKSISDDY